jgi:hypothetical protein
MFPDKIGRLVVDGVMDVEDYFMGMSLVCPLTYQTLTNPVDRWSDEMRDSDVALNLFYEACAEAGPDACALHDADAAKIYFRMEKVFKELQERPIAVPPQRNTTSLQSDYGVVDYGMVRVFVFFFLYAPYAGRTTSAASLAAALAAMEKRDGRSVQLRGWQAAGPARARAEHGDLVLGQGLLRRLTGVPASALRTGGEGLQLCGPPRPILLVRAGSCVRSYLC